jgi:8-oxo-dGTP pyrophosphatase MutT (NUDIX family)
MPVDRPAPGEELNTGEVVTPRPAATLILLRDGRDGPEVLLVQRNPRQRFMGGLWVFPGGATGDDDADPLQTALRELEEEAGIRLEDPDAPAFARWITPRELAIRFDAWFFVAAAPPGAEPRIDGSECVDARWLRPADALAACERDELGLAFPTYKQLDELARFASVEEALESARSRSVTAIEPRLAAGEETIDVLIDGREPER